MSAVPRPTRRIGRKPASALAATALAAAIATTLAASDWPSYFGPNRDGISSETGLAKSWPESGPTLLWRVELGAGYSGPAVVAGRVFTMDAAGSDESALALDAASGAELWRTPVGRSRRDPQGGGPRATPVISGDIVCVLGATADLACLDVTSGEVRWSLDLHREMGARVPEWGVASSPLIDGERLIVQVGGNGKRAFAAFDKDTGKLLWSSGSARPGYAAPIVATLGGIRQAVFFTADQVVGVAVADGLILWSAPWHTEMDVNAATPLFVPANGILLSSGYDTGAALFQVVQEQGGAFRVYEIWRNRLMRNHYNGSVRVGKVLYGFDEDILKCLDVLTGKELWKGRAGGKGSLIYADGKLIVLSGDGELHLLEENPHEMVELASARVLRDRTWAAPALSDGVLYVRGFSEMVAVRLAVTSQGTE